MFFQLFPYLDNQTLLNGYGMGMELESVISLSFWMEG